MNNGTPCSSQLIWCETRIEKLERDNWGLRKSLESEREAIERLTNELAAAQEEIKTLHQEAWRQTNTICAAQAREKMLLDALESVRQYGSDTLSGRIDGPDDRAWQRGAVLEMTRRARVAIDAPADEIALKALLKAERERCAMVCLNNSVDGYGYLPSVADAIRSLGDE